MAVNCQDIPNKLSTHVCTAVSYFHHSTYNKKSELMLMRCARAHSSSCSQVILVNVHPSCLNSLFCSQKSQKFTKTPYFVVEGHSKSLMLTALKSTLPVLVMISSTSVPICKRFHAIDKRIAQKSPLFNTRVHRSHSMQKIGTSKTAKIYVQC